MLLHLCICPSIFFLDSVRQFIFFLGIVYMITLKQMIGSNARMSQYQPSGSADPGVREPICIDVYESRYRSSSV